MPDLELDDAGGHDDEAHDRAETRNGEVVEFRYAASSRDGDWRPRRNISLDLSLLASFYNRSFIKITTLFLHKESGHGHRKTERIFSELLEGSIYSKRRRRRRRILL